MVTPRKKSAPASTNANPAKVSSRPKAVTQKTASDGAKKSAASPAKAATAEISEAATERPKRVVTTASALEAEALRHPPVAEPSKPDAVVPEANKEPVAAQGAEAPAKADDPVKAEAAESKPAPEQAREKTTAGPKPASRPKAATTSKKNTVMPASKAVSEPKVSVSSEKASGAISETPLPAKKASIVTEQEKAAAPAKVTAAAKAETKAKDTKDTKDAQKTAVEVKVAAQPTAAGDVAAFGAVSLEPFTELWKAPEVDTMVAATQDALEGSLTAVNDVLAQVTEKITEQADIFSDAGTQMMARYEELIETQQKSFEGVWQVSSELMEKSGSFGAELASWAQREVDASQADFEALSKVESLSELQELNERILKRYVESGMSEGEKIQKMMFAAFTDGFAAMSKAAGVPLK